MRFSIGTGTKHPLSSAGVTLVELVVVLVLLAIIAIVAVVRGPSIPVAQTNQAAAKIKSDIRYAQSYALSSQARARISFDADAESYNVYYESGGSWTLLTDPQTRGDFTVDLTVSEFSGVDIVQTDFNGTDYGLVFDAAGAPYGYDPSDGSTAALSSQGSVTLGGSVTVTVQPNTGRAKVE